MLSVLLAAVPCTKEQAEQTTGKWGTAEDDLAMADRSIGKAQYPALLAKADRVLELVRAAVPELRGIDAKTQRSIRGDSYVKEGAIKYGGGAKFFAYYCVPERGFAEDVRGKIRLGGETGTQISFAFNSLDWLANEKLYAGLKTPKGANVLWVPKTVGQLDGVDILAPDIHRGRRGEEAMFIMPAGRTPYVYLSRGEYVQFRIAGAKRPEEIAALETALAALSEEERKHPAVVKSVYARPPKEALFVSEAEGRRLATVDGKLFRAQGDRQAIRMMTIYWTWDLDAPAKVQAIETWKAKLKVAALSSMIE